MSGLLLGLGFAFVIEGLVLALAPSRMEDLLRVLAGLSPDQRRMLGLAALAAGVGLVVVARHLGG
jgi:uncharacterized protein YjeT (DUF2065 family)